MEAEKRADLSQRLLRWSKRIHVQRYLRLAVRCLRMHPREAATRLQLAIRKRCRISPLAGTEVAERNAREFVAALGPDIKASVSASLDARFFHGPSHRAQLSRALLQSLPLASSNTIAMAQALLNGGVDLLSQPIRLINGTIDWQADPVSGKHLWPDASMDERDAISTGGDVKHVWEINRHQFLVILGRAFWLSGDAEYARRAAFLIEDWIERNPVGRGVNWASHLEVAMRAISWLWVLPYLLAWPGLNARFLQQWLHSLTAHHRHLARNLSIYTDPTNHLIGEATALWMLSVCLPELPGARQQAARAQNILIRELGRQVSIDGVNREQASSYHRFVLDFYLQVVVLARRNQRTLPAMVEERVQVMLEFAAALAGAHGHAPMIGDSDDARGLPIPQASGWDFRDLLSTGAALFRRAEWKQAAGGIAEATVWLLGPGVVKDYAALQSAAARPGVGRIFSDGGYCFMPMHVADEHAELIFDCGPLGLLPNAAHGHADALSVLLRIGGATILGDPGTGTYFADARVRNALRCTAAHNTLSVDALDQADPFATFKWVNPMRSRLVESYTGMHFDYAHAMHDGYTRLRKPVLHWRSVLSVKPWGWIIVDRLNGKGTHSFTRHFNFPPTVRLRKHSACSVVAIDSVSGHGVRLDFPELVQQPACTLRTDLGGLWSERYGRWQQAPRLEVACLASVPQTLFTFVTPIPAQEQGTAATVFDHAIEHRDAEVVLCSRSAEGHCSELVLVNPAHAQVDLPDGMSTSSHLLFLRWDSSGAVERAWLAGGALNGSRFQMSGSPEGRFSAFVRSHHLLSPTASPLA
jgi:hypothetical protein